MRFDVLGGWGVLPRLKFPPSCMMMVQDGLLLGSVDATDAERGTEAGGNGEEEKSGLKNSSPEWVACPVCGKSIRGGNSCINDHLGKQLS